MILSRQFYSVIICLVFFGQCLPSWAQSGNPWEIYIKTHSIDHWLDFPASNLHPVAWASVSYILPDSTNRTEKPYEDLYFSKNTAIGLKQHGTFAVPVETAGVIRVFAGGEKMTPTEENAAAGAIARLTLDLYLKKCPIKTIYIPDASFKSIILSLRKYGFSQSPTLKTHEGDPVMMYTEVVSDTRDQQASISIQGD